MAGGYMGKMLFVDLTSGAKTIEDLTDDMAEKFIGGYGIGARILYSRMNAGANALGPENMLGFVTGPLTGFGAQFGTRYCIVHKSPVTGGWNDASSGGYWGVELKKAGLDAVFVSGAADHPVYLWIEGDTVDQVQVKDASHLWGMDTCETLKTLEDQHRPTTLRAAVIGPAGENLSLMACVINEKHRAAGRGGCGAVMGSKNLKAIVVHGTKQVPVHSQKQLNQVDQSIKNQMKDQTVGLVQALGKWGTSVNTAFGALNGDSPVKNWGGVGVVDFGFPAAGQLNVITYDDLYNRKKWECDHCPLGCGAEYRADGGNWPVGDTYRPEYETMAAFGTLCLNSNVDSIIKVNDICNRYGLDTIATGCTVAWAIECYENGILTKADTNGVELKWGNADGIVAITQAIADTPASADKTKFPAILFNGSLNAAKALNTGLNYLNTVKGIEVPMHDPKFAPGFARTYQLDPTPARHVKGGLGWFHFNNPNPANLNPAGSGPPDVALTAATEVLNAAGLCLFGGWVMPAAALSELITAVTGLPMEAQDQFNTGKRILDMRHAFNLREGFTPADFVLPNRAVGNPPQTTGPLSNVTIDPEPWAQNWLAELQWDPQTGKPSKSSLQALGGMDDVIQDLYGP